MRLILSSYELIILEIKHIPISEQVDENQSKTIEFSEFLTLMASETWNEIEKGEIVKVRINILL